MRTTSIGLFVVAAALIAGCGGGGGGAINTVTTVTPNLTVNWPARSRGDLDVPLSSALSARIVLSGAAADGSDVTVNISRDSTRIDAHAETYQIPAVLPKNVSLTAQFYAQDFQQGTIVGTASGTANLGARTVDVATINVVGTIASVDITSTFVTLGATQPLLVNAKNGTGQIVVVSTGSAIFNQVSGTITGIVDKSGSVNGLAVGTILVNATVDGVTSPNKSIKVVDEKFTLQTFFNGGGNYVNPAMVSSNGVVATGFRDTGSSDSVPAVLPGGVIPHGNAFGEARWINTAGQIVGSLASDSLTQRLPVFWQNDRSAPVALQLPANAVSGRANAINDSGAIVGSVVIGTQRKAVYWANSAAAPQLLNLAGAQVGEALQINVAGHILGTDNTNPLVWTNPNSAPIKLQPLAGDNAVNAIAISDNDLVVGNSPNGAVSWSGLNPVAADIPALDQVTGVNAAGDMVGLAAGVPVLLRSGVVSNLEFLFTQGTTADSVAGGPFFISNSGHILLDVHSATLPQDFGVLTPKG